MTLVSKSLCRERQTSATPIGMTCTQAAAAVLLIALPLFASAELDVDVQTIAGKSVSEVAKVLGKASGPEKTKYGSKMLYKGGKVEVVFIAGKADWITISNLTDVPFTPKAIEALGLKAAPPTFKSDIVMRWEPCGPFTSVAIFNANGRVDYAYIKTATR